MLLDDHNTYEAGQLKNGPPPDPGLPALNHFAMVDASTLMTWGTPSAAFDAATESPRQFSSSDNHGSG